MSNCLNPRKAWLCGNIICKDGIPGRRLVFNPRQAVEWFDSYSPLRFNPKFNSSDGDKLATMEVELPCGCCPNCVAKARRDMSTRLCQETSQHEVSTFITLTYDDKSIPLTDGEPFRRGDESVRIERGLMSAADSDCFVPTLLPRDVQLFIKRLRRRVEYHYGIKGLRYFAVGEYGGKTRRPHYHIILFGWSPNDKRVLHYHKGNPIFVSDTLQGLWSYGFHTISEVNSAVAKYVARYTVKKLVVADTATEAQCPCFNLQSTRNGAIGATWLDKWFMSLDNGKGTTSFRCGNRVITASIPRYYYNRLRKTHIDFFLCLRDERLAFVDAQKFAFLDLSLDARNRRLEALHADTVRAAQCYTLQFEHERLIDNF